ncbi:MAG TPA: hypothetical protein VFW40_04220 [Capsulimonadaceae bacterium]|nr:hypothetical protein [Capsulimonadaceae bacterium]
MEKKSVLRCRDGRVYNIKMSWNPDFNDNDYIYPIKFQVVDQASGRSLRLPREIATFAIGDPLEPLGERARTYYSGNREAMLTDYLEMAFRRTTDWVQRGK